MKLRITAMLMAAVLAACAQTNRQTDAGNADTPALAGEWQILRIDGRPVSAPDYRLAFDAQSPRFSAYFGCNRLFGRYRQHGGQLRFEQIASTRMACPGNNDEERGKAALTAVARAQTDAVKAPGLRLSLRDGDGRIRLEAQAAQP